MARYILNNGALVQVRKVEHLGQIITNPPDSLIDELAAGKPYETVSAPEYDADTQALDHSYTEGAASITDSWAVRSLTATEQIAKLEAQIATINAAYETYRDTPIMYTNGKGYLPRWVYEFYNSMLLMGSGAFPMSVSAVDGTAESMSYTDFQALFQFLITTIATHTGEVNASIAALNAQIAALREGAE